jgi:hypothetical protein
MAGAQNSEVAAPKKILLRVSLQSKKIGVIIGPFKNEGGTTC